LTKEAAERYFGDDIAMEERLTLFINSTTKIELEVLGVFENMPPNISFDASSFISEATYLQAIDLKKDDWKSRYSVSQFIKAQPNNLDKIEKQISTYLPLQNENHKEMKITAFELVPFRTPLNNQRDIYRSNSNRRIGDEAIIIFSVLSLMIFLVACFNLTNSFIALIANRLKEIGIRKTLGSESRKILTQFLVEMGLICSFALLTGLLLVNTISGFVLGLFGSSFPVQNVDLTGMLIFLSIFLLFTTLVAGIMPALYAWRFQPISIIRGSAKLKGVGWINKTLIVSQFALSISVLIASLTFANNVTFLKEMDPGYQKEGVYVIEFDDKDDYLDVKDQIDQIPSVSTSGADHHIKVIWNSGRRKLLEIDTLETELKTYSVDVSYLKLLQIPIASGRDFIAGSQAEAENGLIVNEEFANRYFSDQDPIGKNVKIEGESKSIVGVVSNIVQDVYDDEKLPIAFLPKRNEKYRYLIVNSGDANPKKFESKVKEIWSETVDLPYKGSWQNDLAFGNAVSDSKNLKIIYTWVAILGSLMSVAGIFSLSRLNIAKRTKEISIRKVLGSTLRQLVIKINRPFIIILAMSMILGSVLGYYVSEMMVSMLYAYYESASVLLSVLVAASIGAIAFVIIVLSVLRPAKANPVLGLRQE
ncbi:MAG: FtsX-like permease family protein, partial [Bacteroidota bacterium]